jgi:hypothetical protein
MEKFPRKKSISTKVDKKYKSDKIKNSWDE